MSEKRRREVEEELIAIKRERVHVEDELRSELRNERGERERREVQSEEERVLLTRAQDMVEKERNEKETLRMEKEFEKKEMERMSEELERMSDLAQEERERREEEEERGKKIVAEERVARRKEEDKFTVTEGKFLEFKRMCREEVMSLGTMLRETEEKRKVAEEKVLKTERRFLELEEEMARKADEIMVVEAESKERESMLREKSLLFESNENALKETHRRIEDRLKQTTLTMENLQSKFNMEREKTSMLEVEQSKHARQLSSTQKKLQEVELQRDAHEKNYSLLRMELESDARTDSKRTEETVSEAKNALLSEIMKRTSSDARIIELEDLLSRRNDELHESSRQCQDMKVREEERKKRERSVGVSSSEVERVAQMMGEKTTLLLRVRELEREVERLREEMKRLKKENTLLATETAMVQQDLRGEHQVVEVAARQQKRIFELENQCQLLLNEVENGRRALLETKELNEREQKRVLEKESETAETAKNRGRAELEQERRAWSIQLEKMSKQSENKVSLLEKELERERGERSIVERERNQTKIDVTIAREELVEAERQRILSNEKTLQMRRKLDLLTTETELETAMKSELDGIRNEFKSFLTQSTAVVHTPSGERSDVNMSGFSERSDFSSSGREGISAHSGYGSAMSTTSISNVGDFGRTTKEMIDVSMGSSTSSEKNDGDSTSITISKRGSIHVHAPSRN